MSRRMTYASGASWRKGTACLPRGSCARRKLSVREFRDLLGERVQGRSASGHSSGGGCAKSGLFSSPIVRSQCEV
jgi:hypothetical protein